ncbi:ras association domain-containing protein 1 isoform X2 [Protopterus annectens]|uniref:ras association domain-containing protein 1 isoform X2 n=1 Tax=Protopterus annectens TaxID=7888 RepID=UPI001CFA248F|nr:ras association domain-containing protein 1 isoform X2 [Protopterus annectens]
MCEIEAVVTPAFEMTWNSTTSSGYCSQEDSDSELEQFFTARTSFIRKPRKDKDERTEWQRQVLSPSEVEQKVKEYNSQIHSNLFMTLNKDCSYTGFIKVQLKLIRPVSVPASKKPPSIYDARKTSTRPQSVKRRTSFYLPKDTVKHLHISSKTQASEVIEALLKKFMVIDNPRKFALFERSEREDNVYVRKLSDDEKPLSLRLLTGPNEKKLSFVLKENETGEVNWDAFSLPELHNFLRILQREEEEHVKQILQKYARCKEKMQEALASCTPG